MSPCYYVHTIAVPSSGHPHDKLWFCAGLYDELNAALHHYDTLHSDHINHSYTSSTSFPRHRHVQFRVLGRCVLLLNYIATAVATYQHTNVIKLSWCIFYNLLKPLKIEHNILGLVILIGWCGDSCAVLMYYSNVLPFNCLWCISFFLNPVGTFIWVWCQTVVFLVEILEHM